MVVVATAWLLVYTLLAVILQPLGSVFYVSDAIAGAAIAKTRTNDRPNAAIRLIVVRSVVLTLSSFIVETVGRVAASP